MFDTEKGREEILNRRIGTNELNAIQVSLALLDAQREYAMKDRDGDKILEYARRFRSEAGKKNGLYWEAKDRRRAESARPALRRRRKALAIAPKARAPDKPRRPYHGYYYRAPTRVRERTLLAGLTATSLRAT